MNTVDKSDLPDKPTFNRKEIMHLSKLDGRVLDYWEKEFEAFSPAVDHNGEKLYSRQDLETILQIRQWLIVEKVDKSSIRERLQSDIANTIPLPAAAPENPPAKTTLSELRQGLQEILTLLDKNDITKSQ